MILLPHTTRDMRRGCPADAGASPCNIASAARDTSRARLPVVTKAYALLTQRQVISAAHSELCPDAFSNWIRQAVAVQQAIYRIDLYYEQSIRIEAAAETPMWSAVEHRLRAGPAAGSPRIWSTLDDLRHYADYERRVHAMDSIDPREFGAILSLKCADVHIARTLIWSYSRRAPGAAELAFWSLYDQCWELIEDLEDLDEDGKDWNFNFWLYLFMSGQSAVAGVDSATGLLRRKLVELQNAHQRLPASCRPLCQDPLAKTLAAAEAVERFRGRVLAAIAAGDVTTFAECLRGEDPIPADVRSVSGSAWEHPDDRSRTRLCR